MLALCNGAVPTAFFYFNRRMFGFAIDVIGFFFYRSDRVIRCAAGKLALGGDLKGIMETKHASGSFRLRCLNNSNDSFDRNLEQLIWIIRQTD